MKYFILILLLFSLKTQAALKVAIVDAFFCHGLKSKNVVIKKTLDMTGENDPYGKKCEETRQYHGHKVARAFLEAYKGAHPLELYLYKVFKKDGNQDLKALKETLSALAQEKIDVTIMAIGFFGYENLPKIPPTLTFAASGAEGFGIKSSDKLWPQMSESENVMIFAHYFPSQGSSKKQPIGTKTRPEGHIDPSLMNLKEVDLMVPSPPNPPYLSGSSLAVATGSGLLLRRCFPLKTLSKCLLEQTQELTIKNSPVSKIFRTFK